MIKKYNLSKNKPYKIKRRKKTIFSNKYFWILFFLIIFLAVAFYFAIFYPFFQISHIEISGVKKVQTQEIENIIAAAIQKKIIFFDTKSIFLANPKEMNKKILEKFLQIKTADIKRKLPDTLVVLIEERIVVANYCQNDICFHIDDTGIAFENGENEGDIVIKNNNPSPQILPGKQVLKKEYVDAILKIQRELKRDFDIIISYFSILDSESKMEVLTQDSGKFYFNMEGDMNSQIVNLNSVLKEQIPTEKRMDLEYIDLRFGDKVFYKYKGQ